MATLQGFITNLGKYNEGELIGKWIDFPIYEDELNEALSSIGIDGKHYEEYFFSDFNCNDCATITKGLDEYEAIDRLNALAELIENMEDDILIAIAESNEGESLETLINEFESYEDYYLLSDVYNNYDLGDYWINESGCYDLTTMGNLAYYIDYERFGRDIYMNECGTFTSKGYLYKH